MTRWATILLASLIALHSAPTAAQMACGTRDAVVEKLNRKYGEVWHGGGLASPPTAIFEIWASNATGTWTILKTYPNGWTCIMAVGDGWHDDEQPSKGKKT